jgi:hypothetical protein
MINPPNFGRELLAAMSDRRIKSVRDIIKRLKFVTKDVAQSESHDLLRCIFQYRVLRWLHGKGHPEQLGGAHISQAVQDAERDDPLVRARLMLRAITDSDLLPLDPSFHLTVSFLISVS